MANPIWKDYLVTLGTEDSYNYRIELEDGTIIYSGVAYKRPGLPYVAVRINDICADFLHTELRLESNDIVISENASIKILIKVLSNGSYVKRAEVELCNDWSYDADFHSEYVGISAPIRSSVPRHMPLPYSVLSSGELEYGREGEPLYLSSPQPGRPGTWMINLSSFEDGDTISIKESGVEAFSYYFVKDSCERYALYYVNAYGGVDMLVIDGNHAERDNLTRQTRSIEYDNRDAESRGTENYVNVISKSMTLHTSWMSDDESSRMHHLLNSTNVCLYDSVRRELLPVLLTNTTTEYKTYKSNGNKLVNYTIEVAFANERIRR